MLGSEKPAETRLCEEAATVQPVQPEVSGPKVEMVSVSLPPKSDVKPVAKAPINKWVVVIGLLAVVGVVGGALIQYLRTPKAKVKK